MNAHLLTLHIQLNYRQERYRALVLRNKQLNSYTLHRYMGLSKTVRFHLIVAIENKYLAYRSGELAEEIERINALIDERLELININEAYQILSINN